MEDVLFEALQNLLASFDNFFPLLISWFVHESIVFIFSLGHDILDHAVKFREDESYIYDTTL